MTNCIFYSIFFVLFLNVSFGSLRFSQVNRVFMSIYKGMLEASVLTIDDNGEPIMPYFNMDTMSSYVTDYLERNLSKYTTNYSVDTWYINEDTKTLCTSVCRQIHINLKAKINVFYDYDRTQTFTVRSFETI